jgi:hypothetical protein
MSPRGRRLRYPPRLNVPPGPVTIRLMSSPKPGWRQSDAVDLVQQGYTPAHAERVTGWAASVIEAELTKTNRTQETRGKNKRARRIGGLSMAAFEN